MTDSEWHEKCKANWEALADDLVSQGYERRDWSHSLIPATFHKNGNILYLARQLGSSIWYASHLQETQFPNGWE